MPAAPQPVPGEARLALLRRLEDRLEWPMAALGLVWLALLVVELVSGLSPPLQALGTAIWIAFLLDFAFRLALAPQKLVFLAHNWLAAISLFVPALRFLRFARLARLLRATRTVRGLRLLRVVSAVNRGIRTLGASMERRGFGYVVALSVVVTLAGAAGMYAFERDRPDGGGIEDYGDALWWTAMIMTTMGSDYWPQSAEGRVLCVLLALYAFAVFGYVTASLATFFIGREAGLATGREEDAPAGANAIEALRVEVAALRAELRAGRPAAGATVPPSSADDPPAGATVG